MSKITVFTARKVVTMDPGRPVAEAVAVMDGRIVSTGNAIFMSPGGTCRIERRHSEPEASDATPGWMLADRREFN